MNIFEDHERALKQNRQNELNDALISACQIGDLEKVQSLLTSESLDMHADILASKGSRRHYNLNFPLSIACKNGHLEIVKYLLTSRDLKKHADLEQSNYFAVFEACLYGHLNIVEYFLTSPDLINKPDIHILDFNGNNETLLDIACVRARLGIVRFLLISPKLKEHPNIHKKQDSCFINAASYNTENHIDLVKYLVFEYKIEKTKYIQDFLEKNPDHEIEKWFNLRDFTQELSKDLPTNKDMPKKMKV